MDFVVITPIRDEEKYFHFVAASMIKQSLKPSTWLIVDDGSTDNSSAIIKNYIKKYNWISYARYMYEGTDNRRYGAKVVSAFNYGLRQINKKDFDFLVKLDVDLTLPEDYFQKIAESFNRNPKLGIVGGIIVEKDSDFESKLLKDQFVQGALKAIRKECFDNIGGFWEVNGWDGIDQHLARYQGWEVKNLPIPVVHHRTETSEYLSLDFYFQNGLSSYLLGNNLFLTILRVFKRILEKPIFLGSIWFLMGFIYGMLSKKRLIDKNFAKFIRKYHYSRIKNEL